MKKLASLLNISFRSNTSEKRTETLFKTNAIYIQTNISDFTIHLLHHYLNKVLLHRIDQHRHHRILPINKIRISNLGKRKFCFTGSSSLSP